MLSGLLPFQILPGGSKQDDTRTTKRVRVTCGARKLRMLHTYQDGAGCFWAVVSNDKSGEAGVVSSQAANGPDGENPIEQVEQVASRTDSRAFVRTLQHRGPGT